MLLLPKPMREQPARYCLWWVYATAGALHAFQIFVLIMLKRASRPSLRYALCCLFSLNSLLVPGVSISKAKSSLKAIKLSSLEGQEIILTHLRRLSWGSDLTAGFCPTAPSIFLAWIWMDGPHGAKPPFRVRFRESTSLKSGTGLS